MVTADVCDDYPQYILCAFIIQDNLSKEVLPHSQDTWLQANLNTNFVSFIDTIECLARHYSLPQDFNAWRTLP